MPKTPNITQTANIKVKPIVESTRTLVLPLAAAVPVSAVAVSAMVVIVQPLLGAGSSEWK
jgi:hypothetical protein